MGFRSKRWLLSIAVVASVLVVVATSCWYGYFFQLRAEFDKHIDTIKSCSSASEQSAAIREFAKWIVKHSEWIICDVIRECDRPRSGNASQGHSGEPVETSVEMEIILRPCWPRSLAHKSAKVTIISSRDARVLYGAGRFGVVLETDVPGAGK